MEWELVLVFVLVVLAVLVALVVLALAAHHIVAHDAVDPRILVDGDNLVAAFHGLGGELPH